MNKTYIFYKIVFAVFAFLCMFLVYLLLGFVLYRGFGSISLDLIFSDTNIIDALLFKQRVFDGLFPAIIGTLMLISLSLFFALILGFAAGIYLSIYAQGFIKDFLNSCFELLASVPSILIGLFFLLVSIYLHNTYFENFLPSLLLSSLALALLILPYIIKNTQYSLDQIPSKIRNTALHLGLSQVQNLFHVLLPYASKELLSGVFLALGRACEDTAVIMLTGAVASAGIANSIFSKYEALPFYIYYVSSTYSDEKELNSAFAASLILLLIAISLFIISKFIQKRIRSTYV